MGYKYLCVFLFALLSLTEATKSTKSTKSTKLTEPTKRDKPGPPTKEEIEEAIRKADEQLEKAKVLKAAHEAKVAARAKELGVTPDHIYEHLATSNLWVEGINQIDIAVTPSEWAAMEEDIQELLNDYSNMWTRRGQEAMKEVEKREKESGLDRFHENFDNSGIEMKWLTGGQPIFFQRIPRETRADVKFKNEVWPNATMQWKGASSLQAAHMQKAYKRGFILNFAQEFKFLGYRRLIFSPCYQDNIFIRDKLMSDLLRSSGLNCPRASLFRVNIHLNGHPQYFGLYTMIEDTSDKFVESFVDDETPGSTLFEPENGTWALPLNKMEFQIARGPATEERETLGRAPPVEGDSHALVARTLDALHDASRETDPAQWRAGLEEVFDVNSFITCMAMYAVLGNWDSYGTMPHNYYLYTLNGRLTWVPFDHNLALQDAPSNIPMPSVMRDEAEGDKWPLLRFMLDDPVYRAEYIKEMRWAISEHGPCHLDKLKDKAKQLSELVSPHVIGGKDEEGNKIIGEVWPLSMISANVTELKRVFKKGRVDILAFMIWNNDRVIAALKKEGVDMDAPVEADGGRRRQVFLNVFRSEADWANLGQGDQGAEAPGDSAKAKDGDDAKTKDEL